MSEIRAVEPTSPEPHDATDAESATDMVGKALRLLVVLSEFPSGASISDIARIVGYPLSTTHRLLRSLSKQGFVSNDQELRRYTVGLRVFEIGQRVSQARGFAGIAAPVLERVVDATGEATLLGVRVGHEQLYVHCLPSPRPVQIKAAPGYRGPLHCTSMGKVLVAFSPDPVRETLLNDLQLDRFTPTTTTDRKEFHDEIERVRARGYATSLEEYDVGVNTIAVPVLDTVGGVIAAVACAAPASRAPIETILEFLPSLNDAAEQLAVLLPRP
jgi:IclR family acetate operon transcriptional repressor